MICRTENGPDVRKPITVHVRKPITVHVKMVPALRALVPSVQRKYSGSSVIYFIKVPSTCPAGGNGAAPGPGTAEHEDPNLGVQRPPLRAIIVVIIRTH